jgi:curved DNA-binding protein
MAAESPMTLTRARTVLGLDARATGAELRRAFREAAKQAHPDRAGGGGEPFREVVEAYHRLQQPAPTTIIQPPAVREPQDPGLSIDPLMALRGGDVRHRTADGRTLKIALPAGLRSGDTVRAGGVALAVTVRGEAGMLVRGDDLWITAPVEPRTLAEGGRLSLATPLGRRILWVTKKAGERGLVRLAGQGLPARGPHAQGHLFIRLAARQGEAHSAARTLLRRFTAAWAA